MPRLAMILALTITALLPAQQLVQRSFVPGSSLVETDAITIVSAFPDPTPNFTQPHVTLPFVGANYGDLTFDNVTGVYYETNGLVIAQWNDVRYPQVPIATVPIHAPARLGLLTGLAVDPSTNVLWATDGVLLAPLSTTPPFALLAAPIPFGFRLTAPPMVGLERDPITDVLLGCDLAGNVYRFDRMGFALGAQPALTPSRGLKIVGNASDLAVSHSGGMAAGLYVQFVGFGVVEYLSGSVQPTVFDNARGGEAGLAFHNAPITLPGACECPQYGFTTFVGAMGSATTGCMSFTLALHGGPPMTFVYNAVAFGELYRNAWPGGGALWLPYDPPLIHASMTNPFGTAVVPLPIPDLPWLVGLAVTSQWAIPCINSPVGATLSDGQYLLIGAP